MSGVTLATDKGYVVRYHSHGGSDGDGNGMFWSNDIAVNLSTGITTLERESSGYGQGGNYDRLSLSSNITRGLTVPEQTAIYETLKPFIELKQKYPRRESFQYFSTKQRYFYTGRVSKAIDLAGRSDYHGINCLAHVFVLPVYGLIISVYTGAQDRYSHFTVRIDSAIGWADYDYYQEC